ncbi:HAD family hydrolase [Candidatus Woesearchaeota archaeon]|nr:HAD family hydrolase [Candidatus Woesearchaeota archaeon]
MKDPIRRELERKWRRESQQRRMQNPEYRERYKEYQKIGKNKNKVVILDRDGTIVEDTGYVHKVEDFKLLPNVIEGLRKLRKFMIFIVTNQSGIGRRVYKLEDFKKFNDRMIDELGKHKIKIERIYYCPHVPEENCGCRKPKLKFLKEAEKQYGIDLKKSYVIGDKKADVELGRNAKCKSILVLTGDGNKTKKEVEPDFVAKDLLEAAEWIIEDDKK